MTAERNDTPASTTPATARQRGVGFPLLPLAEVVAVLADVIKHGRTMSLVALAGYLGHKTTNSGPFKGKLSALKDWGVISTKGEQGTITDLGVDLAVGSIEDQPARLQKMFLSIRPFASLYADLPLDKAQPRDQIGKLAVARYHIGAPSREAFVASFVASAVAAGLGTSTEDGSFIPRGIPQETVHETSDDRFPSRETQEMLDSVMGRSNPGQADRRPPGAEPVLRQVWPVNGGQVLLEVRLNRPLPGSAFTQIGTLVERAEELAKALGDVADDAAE